MSSQITALLNRLNTGCRSIDHSENEVSFKDNKHTNKSSSKAISLATCNTLRNASQCDEIHAELGCALGHSYIESLLCSSSTTGIAMKQDTDFIMNCTIGKCTQDYEFIENTEIQLIGCVYYCGWMNNKVLQAFIKYCGSLYKSCTQPIVRHHPNSWRYDLWKWQQTVQKVYTTLWRHCITLGPSFIY